MEQTEVAYIVKDRDIICNCANTCPRCDKKTNNATQPPCKVAKTYPRCEKKTSNATQPPCKVAKTGDDNM